MFLMLLFLLHPLKRVTGLILPFIDWLCLKIEHFGWNFMLKIALLLFFLF